jgi:hypothetical protein
LLRIYQFIFERLFDKSNYERRGMKVFHLIGDSLRLLIRDNIFNGYLSRFYFRALPYITGILAAYIGEYGKNTTGKALLPAVDARFSLQAP